jgi:hypothetical protein
MNHDFSNTNVDDISYYSQSGEYLEDIFTLRDFVREPTTRAILDEQHNILFEQRIEPCIKTCYNNIKKEIDDTDLLNRDNRGLFYCDLLKLIYNHVNKKYNLEIFYENPSLARVLLIKLKLKNSQQLLNNL